MKLRKLAAFLDKEIGIGSIEDGAINGLQVEGPAEVRKVALAVDACMESFESSRASGADLIIAHHGLFWSGFDGLRGVLYSRVRFLIENRMGLYAAHLPLDRHPVIGNNAVLCGILGLSRLVEFAKVRGKPIGFHGSFRTPKKLDEIADILRDRLHCSPKVIKGRKNAVRTAGVVSGGGGTEFKQARELDLDCYITGEASYHVFHDAIESGKSVIFAGHYETETVGLHALGRLIERKLGLKTVFADVPGPGY